MGPARIIEEAEYNHQHAAEELIRAVDKVYPQGTLVEVTFGKSTFVAKIEGPAGNWWCEPGRVIARNVKTGKMRKFNWRDINKKVDGLTFRVTFADSGGSETRTLDVQALDKPTARKKAEIKARSDKWPSSLRVENVELL